MSTSLKKILTSEKLQAASKTASGLSNLSRNFSFIVGGVLGSAVTGGVVDPFTISTVLAAFSGIIRCLSR